MSERPSPPKVPRPDPAPRVAVDAAAYTHDHRRGPHIAEHSDGTSTVTFYCDDPEAQAVLLFVNRLTDERNLDASCMERDGSGRWMLSCRMRSDWRASYAYLIHRGPGEPPWARSDEQVGLRALLDTGEADPYNELWTLNRDGRRVSIIELPKAPAQPWRSGPDSSRPQHGTISSNGIDRNVWFDTVGAVAPDSPLVMVTDGDIWLGHFGLATSLSMAHEAGALDACHVVYVDTGDRQQRWQDVGRPDGLTQALAGPVAEAAVEYFGLDHRADRTIVTGQSLGGVTALWAVAEHRDVVGVAVAQSSSLWLPHPGNKLADVPARLWLEVGAQEWLLRPIHHELRDELRAAGGSVELEYREFNGGHDYACWRGSLIDGIAWATGSEGVSTI